MSSTHSQGTGVSAGTPRGNGVMASRTGVTPLQRPRLIIPQHSTEEIFRVFSLFLSKHEFTYTSSVLAKELVARGMAGAGGSGGSGRGWRIFTYNLPAPASGPYIDVVHATPMNPLRSDPYTVLDQVRPIQPTLSGPFAHLPETHSFTHLPRQTHSPITAWPSERAGMAGRRRRFRTRCFRSTSRSASRNSPATTAKLRQGGL
jgi:hypothetical protein